MRAGKSSRDAELRRRWRVWGVALALLMLSPPGAGAQEEEPPAAPEATEPSVDANRAVLEAAIKTRVQGNEQTAEIQKQIDEIADETDAISAQYRTALKQIEAIRKFNDQMRSLVDSQQAELHSVADQLDRVEEVGRNVTPLTLRMIEALEVFVDLDMPFLREERMERIAELRRLMDRADISVSTKFRQIMEAYQVENEYGRTIEAYRGSIEVDGREQIVDLLRFGRIALVFQSLDGTMSGAWNAERRAWEVLDSSYDEPIRRGIRIARKLEPPDLIDLPLPPPASGAAPEPEVASTRGGGSEGATP